MYNPEVTGSTPVLATNIKTMIINDLDFLNRFFYVYFFLHL